MSKNFENVSSRLQTSSSSLRATYDNNFDHPVKSTNTNMLGYEYKLTSCDIYSMDNLFSRLKISRFDSLGRFSFVEAQF